MAQLNLICHGMMLFVEHETGMDILVPKIDHHDYALGSPSGTPCKQSVGDLPPGLYTLSGDFSANGGGLDTIDPNDHLLLHADKVNIVRAEHIAISTPKPDRVRMFRPIGPPDVNIATTVMGSVPRDTVLAIPTFVHDVVAFVFDGIPDGSEVTFGSLFTAVVRDGAPTNLCVYAQIGPESTPADPKMPTRHETGLNDLLKLVSSSRPPDFMLSAVAEAPEHAGPLPEGIDECSLKSLFELVGFTTSGTGCSPAFVLRR
jgi:hypothetical protein